MTKKASITIFSIIIQLLLIFPIFAKGWVTIDGNWKYETESGEYLADEILKSGEDKFYLDHNGNLAMNYLYDNGDSIYYFGADGKMVTDTWASVDGSQIDDPPFEASSYYFYFGNNGKAIRADNGKIRTIDGKAYMFSERGIMLVGWLSHDGNVIDAEDGDDWYSSESVYYAHPDGSLCEGWLAISDYYRHEEYTNAGGELLTPDYLYFYFDPKSHKKVEGHERIINGNKYAFQSGNGHMFTEWEYFEEKYENDSASSVGSAGEHNISNHPEYDRFYSGTDDGSLIKNQWIYEVPSKIIDAEKFDDEEKEWFYTQGAGNFVVDQIKKIDGKKYIFDKRGIMRKGLILLKGDKFYCEIDLEKTTYDDFVKSFTYYTKSTKDNIFYNGNPIMETNVDFYLMKKYDTSIDSYSLKYFGDDGALVTGDNIKVEFSDGPHEFSSNNKGGFAEFNKKKYYVNGFLMKANKGDKYGIFINFFVCTDNGRGGLTNQSQFDPILLSYGGNLLKIIPYPAEQVEAMFAAKGYPKWYAYLPLGRIYYEKGKGDTSGDNNKTDCQTLNLTIKSILEEVFGLSSLTPKRTGNTGYIVNENGKIMDKGAYNDGNGYYVVDHDKKFIGYFSVPIKWKKIDGVDTPHYKSDLKEYDTDGKEKIKTNQWIPFGTKDAQGFTESNYVMDIPTDACLNFVPGTYSPLG